MSRVLGPKTVLTLQAVAAGYAYGFDIMDATGLPGGTVYPALATLEEAELVRSRWEAQETAIREKRPARRNYQITASGRKALAAALAEARARERLTRSWTLRPRRS